MTPDCLLIMTDVMGHLCEQLPQYELMITNSLEKKEKSGFYADVPLEQQTEYAVENADTLNINILIKNWLHNEKLFHDVELLLVEVTAMEQERLTQQTFLKI